MADFPIYVKLKVGGWECGLLQYLPKRALLGAISSASLSPTRDGVCVCGEESYEQNKNTKFNEKNCHSPKNCQIYAPPAPQSCEILLQPNNRLQLYREVIKNSAGCRKTFPPSLKHYCAREGTERNRVWLNYNRYHSPNFPYKSAFILSQ